MQSFFFRQVMKIIFPFILQLVKRKFSFQTKFKSLNEEEEKNFDYCHNFGFIELGNELKTLC